jgi:maltose alpha-D-glucosyltransferase / alpha-amylase
MAEHLQLSGSWTTAFSDEAFVTALTQDLLPDYLRQRRWFTSKSRELQKIRIEHAPRLEYFGESYYLALLEVRFTTGDDEVYILPLARTTNVARYRRQDPEALIGEVRGIGTPFWLVDGLYEPGLREAFFAGMWNERIEMTDQGTLRFEPGKILRNYAFETAQSRLLKTEQSNTSIVYEDKFFFKTFRKQDTDINPDLELVRFLSERAGFAHAPQYGGSVFYYPRGGKGTYYTLGLMQNMIENEGQAWSLMLELARAGYDRILASETAVAIPPLEPPATELPQEVEKLIGKNTLERAALLGQRTAELHIALASDPDLPDFSPEPFDMAFQQHVHAGFLRLLDEKMAPLAERVDELPTAAKADAEAVLARQGEIRKRFDRMAEHPFSVAKTRVHGDYHLGQVLHDKEDFYIIDFEGEPLLSIAERREKRTPFKDVAGMVRSFHYAAIGALLLGDQYDAKARKQLRPWAEYWFRAMAQAFLSEYLTKTADQPFVPSNESDRDLLLSIYILEKAIYEVAYELNSRPDWLPIPLRGVLTALEGIEVRIQEKEE